MSLLVVLLGLVLLGLVFFGFTWAHLRYWVGRLTLPLEYSICEVLETEDGSHIELRRVPRPAGKGPLLPPVLMVHGIGANHRNNDLHPDASLARSLAALGRDVWLLTLRSGMGYRSRRERGRVRFAAMVKEDLPLAVSTVLARTRAPALDYVGFSMGGMLLYAALGRTVPVASVRRVVIVGSPGQVGMPRHFLSLLRHLPRWMVPGSRFKMGARAFAFASEWFPTPIHRFIVNPGNLNAGMTRAALVNMVEDIPGALNADFFEWAVTDGVIRVDGEPALEGLARVNVPVLFFAGEADRLAPPGAVKKAYDAWGSACSELVSKRLVVLGRAHGSQADYGHGDLAMGIHAAAELFEPIAHFLDPAPPEEKSAPEAALE